jgi:hypothetical protein
MSRITALRFASEGRLLGFDMGDWFMLLGGFAVAGMLSFIL